MSFIQGCLCLVIACGIGAVGVFFVGHLVYAIALNQAIAAGQFVSNPLEGSENYGEAYTFLLNSMLYLSTGLVIGLIVTVQVVRTSYLWSSLTWWKLGSLILISECATCLGAGLLLGLLTASNAYPQLRSSNPLPTGHTFAYFFLGICGLGLLSTNFMLPWLM